MSNYDARDPLQAKMEEESRKYVIDRVDNTVAAGEQPPPLRPIFRSMKLNPEAALSAQTRQGLSGLSPEEATRLRRLHQDYLEGLEERYGHMESVDRAREQ